MCLPQKHPFTGVGSLRWYLDDSAAITSQMKLSFVLCFLFLPSFPHHNGWQQVMADNASKQISDKIRRFAQSAGQWLLSGALSAVIHVQMSSLSVSRRIGEVAKVCSSLQPTTSKHCRLSLTAMTIHPRTVQTVQQRTTTKWQWWQWKGSLSL